MDVQRPVFIIGIGRSGSTVFFDILSRHPELIWLSQRLCNRYPHKPELNRALMKCINLPLAGKLLRRLFEPSECYPYWNTLYRGFGGSYRDLHENDVTDSARRKIRNSLGKMLTKPNDRLVIKITGWNRIGFLHDVFPDALFIHVQRDSRAVINSFLNVYFWTGWKGPQHLLMPELNDEQKNELMQFDDSFVALAGMQVEALMKAHNESKTKLPTEQLFEVNYESLCDDPIRVYKAACGFCDLSWNEKYKQEVSASRLRNTNYKWQQDLTGDQQIIVEYYYNKIGIA